MDRTAAAHCTGMDKNLVVLKGMSLHVSSDQGVDLCR